MKVERIQLRIRESGESAGKQGNLLEAFEAGIGRDLGAHLAPFTHPPISGHFFIWPWSLAPRSSFIHINVEVSSHGAGVSVLQLTAL